LILNLFTINIIFKLYKFIKIKKIILIYYIESNSANIKRLKNNNFF
jgi:hypothetical protein